MENEEAVQPKFAPGQIVKHPLGMKCMITMMFDAVKNEAGEETKLPSIVYELQFLDNNGCLQTTRLSEKFIKE